MVIIVNDDDSYLAWVEANEDGFVVNAENPPRADTVRVHRANCRHITTPARSNWTTTGYMKICSNVMEELDEWAARAVGALPDCASCKQRDSAYAIQPFFFLGKYSVRKRR